MTTRRTEKEFTDSFKNMIQEQVIYINNAMKEIDKRVVNSALAWHREHCLNIKDAECEKEFLITFSKTFGTTLLEQSVALFQRK
jgi:hypothetical protein